MAVYYIDEYIEYAKEKAREAKMKWINGDDWNDEEYEKLKFLEASLEHLADMKEQTHTRVIKDPLYAS